jgi:hypothetical protein
MSVESMLSSGQLDRIEPDADLARAMLADAGRHLESAEAIALDDPSGAFQLAYDGARKAVQALLAYEGLRVRARPGAHAVTAQHAREEVDEELGRSLESMRRRRNLSEYGIAHFEAADVAHAIDVAVASRSASVSWWSSYESSRAACRRPWSSNHRSSAYAATP